ncbi:MAG: ParB N-terminal domain-containing protein, partial [Desulfobacula sp.]|nr:ParB N-terminal domain-containing protein [Desulfobacula sp.]
DQRYNIFSAVTQNQAFLAESLKEIGLISPPIVRPSNNEMNNKYIIISGFNRIRALNINNVQKLSVQVKDKSIKDYECLFITIADLAFRRPLTHAELILAIVKLSSFFDKTQLSKKAPAVFNTKLSEHYIEELLTIGNLPHPALDLINKGNLALKAAKKLCSFQKDAVKVFLSLFSQIKVSLNIQVEMIRNMREIAAYEGISIQDLYEIMGIQRLFEDVSSDRADDQANDRIDRIPIARQIRRLIYERRYPTLSGTQQKLKDKISALNLPETIKITPPDTFESRELNISLTIKKPDDLDKNISLLTDPLMNSKLKDIFSL